MIHSDGLFDRLLAEVIASELRNPQAFLQRRTHSTHDDALNWVMAQAEVHRMDLKASAAEADFAARRAVSRHLGDRSEGKNPIIPMLVSASCNLLQFDGHDLILRVDSKEPGREILQWRFVSLLVPPAILAAAVAAKSGRAKAPPRIRLLHQSMAPDGPVAQQHLHQSASVTFERLWASLRLRAVLDPGKLKHSLRAKRAFCPSLHRGPCVRSMGATKLKGAAAHLAGGDHMGVWFSQLRRAAVAADLLGRHARHAGDINDCADCCPIWSRLDDLLAGKSSSKSVMSYPWPTQARAFAKGRRDALRARKQHGSQLAQPADFLDSQVESESVMLTAAFSKVHFEGENPNYEKLLLQYLRIKSAVYRMIVHAPGRHGLAKFLHHFSQIETYQPSKTSLGLQAAQSPELDLRSTEYRVSPEDWLERERDDSRRERLGRKPGGVEGGPRRDASLIHFQRSEPKSTVPLHGLSIRKLDGYSRRVGNVLAHDMRRLIDLRGVDICGVEEHQPLWVSAQTLIGIRNRSSEIAGRTNVRGLVPRGERIGENAQRMRVEPLRLTMHTGEDFEWLTTGVRTVAEPFRWKVIQRGDRIGHGLAVTLEPAKWWSRREGDVIRVSDFDRLQDLGFLGSLTRSNDKVATRTKQRRTVFEAPDGSERTERQERWLTDQIDAVLDRMKVTLRPSDDPIAVAASLWNAIGSRRMRNLFGSKTDLPDGDPTYWQILHRYIWRKGFRRRADSKQVMELDPSAGCELSLLQEARRIVIRHLARWQIPIESNPSSNLVVGSLDALASQDFLAQTSQQARDRGSETLAWTISTDDPVTFATTLADEYAYAWAGMVLRTDKPYDPAHARALLEEAAATSMRTRFAARPA